MRIKALDIAKGIGIILMVVGHVTAKHNPINVYICQFHMPLFLLISGFLFNEAKWKDTRTFIISRIRLLLRPYLFFASMSLIYWTLLQGRDFFTLITTNIPSAIWFILVLFFVEILFQILNKALKGKLFLFFLAVGAFVFGKMLNYYNLELPYSLASVPVCLSFYTIGFMLKNTPPNSCCSFVPHYRSSLIGGIGLMCVILVFVNGYLRGNYTDLSDNHILWLGFFPAMIGSYGIMCFSVLIERFCNRICNILCWFGQNTLSFIGLNMLLIGLNTLFIKPYVDNVIIYKIIEFVSTMMICVIVGHLLNIYFPWILGKTKYK